MSISRVTGLTVCNHLALCYIHHVNRVTLATLCIVHYKQYPGISISIVTVRMQTAVIAKADLSVMFWSFVQTNEDTIMWSSL